MLDPRDSRGGGVKGPGSEEEGPRSDGGEDPKSLAGTEKICY